MVFYTYRNDPDVFTSYFFENMEDCDATYELFRETRIIKDEWNPPLLRVVGEGLKKPDLTRLDVRFPVFSFRAWDKLESLVSNSVEALPLCEGFLILNVLQILDCLIVKDSKISGPPGRISAIYRPCFRQDRIPESVNIFRIPEMGYSNVYVSERFKESVDGHKLTGAVFKWPSC